MTIKVCKRMLAAVAGVAGIALLAPTAPASARPVSPDLPTAAPTAAVTYDLRKAARHTGESEANRLEEPWKSAIFDCLADGAGPVPISAGGSISELDSPVNARITRLHVGENGLLRVTGEDEGQRSGIRWRTQGRATCAVPQSNRLPDGLEYRTVQTGLDSSLTKVATATCSAGKRVLGLGAAVAPVGTGRLVLTRMNPAANLRSVSVVATEDDSGYDGNWAVTAQAICVDEDYRPILVESSKDNTTQVEANCPATHPYAWGAGFSLSSNEARNNKMHLTGVSVREGFPDQTPPLMGRVTIRARPSLTEVPPSRYTVSAKAICVA